MKRWYVPIGLYLIMHITVMTKYSPLPDHSDLLLWLFTLQWLVPTLMLSLLVPKVQRLLNHVAGSNVWTVVGLLTVAGCIAMYFINIPGRWFAWSTLGLLVLLVLVVANSQTKPRNVSTWLLGAMVVLSAMGCWEVLYQIGLFAYYDFFGCNIMSYYVTIAQQFTWIIPALIAILVLYQRGLRPNVNRIAASCIGVSIVCTVLWFANGMDIPMLFWQGKFVCVNEAARPLLISVSRASQGFWLVGIALLFTRREDDR